MAILPIVQFLIQKLDYCLLKAFYYSLQIFHVSVCFWALHIINDTGISKEAPDRWLFCQHGSNHYIFDQIEPSELCVRLLVWKDLRDGIHGSERKDGDRMLKGHVKNLFIALKYVK